MSDYVPVLAHEVPPLMNELDHAWRVVDSHQLERDLKFPDFAQALAFTNAVGAIAEELNHHPDIHLGWGKVGLVIWTHAIDGLSQHDFALAKRIDAIQPQS